MTCQRQNILILYLESSALDARTIGWSLYEGASDARHDAGDADEPPYPTGLAALRDGWRLLQMSPLIPHVPGDEFRTSYLKYEFLFEKLIDIDPAGGAR
ncbi:MAG: hypothetical protein H6993_10220 [Pseudomonadales bacterium]|nr:hypothetical protein [Pseudomonadales bacterium]MCP5184329.1 hypothetical protein [Pseudomonadales bacterium]